jgi:hypothetical protein
VEVSVNVDVCVGVEEAVAVKVDVVVGVRITVEVGVRVLAGCLVGRMEVGAGGGEVG